MPPSSVEERLGGVAPEVLDLAMAVCLAVKVDPVLLRRARVELVPHADAGTEADLWFSPLVQFSADDGFVLLPAVLQELRRRIAAPERRRLFDASRRIVEESHGHLGFLLRKEEQLIWMALAGKPREDIQHELLRLLRSVASGREGIAAWARRAVPGLPEAASGLPIADALQNATYVLESPTTTAKPEDLEHSDWRTWVPADSSDEITVGIRLFAGALEIRNPPAADDLVRLDLPETDPLLLEVSWAGENRATRTHRLLRLERGKDVRVEGVGPELQIRAKRGTWQLDTASAAEPSVPGAAMVLMQWKNWRPDGPDEPAAWFDSYLTAQRRLGDIVGEGGTVWVVTNPPAPGGTRYQLAYRLENVSWERAAGDTEEGRDLYRVTASPQDVTQFPLHDATDVLLGLGFTSGKPLHEPGDIGRRLQSIPQLTASDVDKLERLVVSLDALRGVRTDEGESSGFVHPGVYAEEVSQPGAIQGVETRAAGFVGPTRYGPTHGVPSSVVSWEGFKRVYGGLTPLDTGSGPGDAVPNYMAHAVRAFFENGGRELFVARVYRPSQPGADGRARGPVAKSPSGSASWSARWPGEAGNVEVTLSLALAGPIQGAGTPTARQDDVLLFRRPGHTPELSLHRFGAGDQALEAEIGRGVEAYVVRARVDVRGLDGADPWVQTDLALHPDRIDSLSAAFPGEAEPSDSPIVLESEGWTDGVAVAETLLESSTLDDLVKAGSIALSTRLSGGDDGARPTADDLAGVPSEFESEEMERRRRGLRALEDVEVSTVAAPGSSAMPDAITAAGRLVAHCETMRYRFALLDPPPGSGTEGDIQAVRSYRARMDSPRAALYYPWIEILDPSTESRMLLPPSGFLAGVYARTDTERGVHKAPANEIIELATGFAADVGVEQQEILNPEGINVLRFMEGRPLVWGARTVSSNPEWKYVPVRRYFDYLERSIDTGTQWVIFEPQGPRLWAQVESFIESFLLDEWRSGRLAGQKPDEAFFVHCDETTMTQSDRDNGHLIIEIGVALVQPAEFMILRIGHSVAGEDRSGDPGTQTADDPYAGFSFLVDLGDESVHAPHAGFAEVSGLETGPDFAEYRDGPQMQQHVSKVPVMSTFSRITLKRGLADAGVLERWSRATLDGGHTLRDIRIVLRDESGYTVAEWEVSNARLVAAARGEVASSGTVPVEELGLDFDRLELVTS